MFDSYTDMGLHVAVDLARARGGLDVDTLRTVLADDPPSVRSVSADETGGFEELASQLEIVLEALADGDVDAAAERVNDLLDAAPTRPHLAREDGRWRLHHHPRHAALVPMWQAICAEAVARAISADLATRVGRCADAECATLFLDTSRNGTRQYCSTRCQNRAKVRSYRRRRATSATAGGA